MYFLILAVILNTVDAAVPPVDKYRLKHLGCWKDSEAYRAIPLLASDLGELCQGQCCSGNFCSVCQKRCGAVEACKNLAIEKGFTVFAVQAGGMCFSSATAEKDYQMHGGTQNKCTPEGNGSSEDSEVYKIVEAGSEEDTVLQTLGCWADDASNPAIASVEGDYDYPVLNGDYTWREFAVEKCKVVAEGLRFSMFGVQDGGKCMTSPLATSHFRDYGESDKCRKDGKGGDSANQIYTIVPNNYTVLDLGCWKTVDWSDENEPTLPVPRLETWDSLLFPVDASKRGMSFENCKQAALKRGYSVFALSEGGSCYSGPDAEHSYRLAGDSSDCAANGLGGPEASQVYEIDPCSCSSTLDDRDWELEKIDYQTEDGDIDDNMVKPDAVTRITIDNRGNSMQAQDTLHVSETVTETSMFQHTAGANLMLGMSFSVGIPLFVEEEFTGELSGDYQKTWGEESSTEKSIEEDHQCLAAPNVILECSGFLWFYNMNVPYTMTWIHRKKSCRCESYGIYLQAAGTETRYTNKEISDADMLPDITQ